MDAKGRHHRICLRLGTLASMIVLSLLVSPVLAGDNHHRHGNSRHTSNHRIFSHQIHDHHHDLHGHHFIIHVPRYYRLSYYGLPVYYGRYHFYRSPYFRRPYYYGYGYSSWPAYNLTGYGGKNGPSNAGPLSGEVVSTQEKNGWELLADGQASLALDVFVQQVQRNPDFGGLKIGYALSVAVVGDLYFGVWEMRRALRINPSSMQVFELPQQLRPTVEALIKKFKAEQLKKTRQHDVSFMLAALHYLMQNPDSAKMAIDLAFRDGDHSQSARHLKRSIDQQATKAQAAHVENHRRTLQRDRSAQKRGHSTEEKTQKRDNFPPVNSL